MKKRVVSVAVLLLLMAVFVFLSEVTRVIFFFIVGILLAYEYSTRFNEKGIHVCSWILYAYSIIQLILTLTHCGSMTYVASFMFMICLAFFSGILQNSVSGEGTIFTVAGLAYPGFIMGLLLIIVSSNHWHQSLALSCIPVWVCDSLCLFGGKWWGKHKLCPEVSPNKTWEGSITGALSSLPSGILVYFICKSFAPLPLWFCILVAFLSSTTGQIGDLAESLLKRYIGVKDFSNLIPGHGGMFDRADSLIFAIPTAYFCLYFFNYFGVI